MLAFPVHACHWFINLSKPITGLGMKPGSLGVAPSRGPSASGGSGGGATPRSHEREPVDRHDPLAPIFLLHAALHARLMHRRPNVRHPPVPNWRTI